MFIYFSSFFLQHLEIIRDLIKRKFEGILILRDTPHTLIYFLFFLCVRACLSHPQYLGLCQSQFGCQICPLGQGEVLGLLEALVERLELQAGVNGPRLPDLLPLPIQPHLTILYHGRGLLMFCGKEGVEQNFSKDKYQQWDLSGDRSLAIALKTPSCKRSKDQSQSVTMECFQMLQMIQNSSQISNICFFFFFCADKFCPVMSVFLKKTCGFCLKYSIK